MRDFTNEYDSLLKGFARYRTEAEALESPNAEDDDLMRMAIIGFSINSKTETWSRPHLDFVRRHLEDDFSDGQLEFLHGDEAHSYALFAALCLGYLLGLFQAGQLSEADFSVGEAQLPGFMAGSAGSLPL
jgi:hypothetical protein